MSREGRALLLDAHNGDADAVAQMITENSGLIWSVARRYFGRGVDPEDLYQLGCVGFLKAIQGFDEQFGTQFSTYAVPKIAGEIRRFLRDDSTIKVSRSIKERALLIRSKSDQLEQKLGRPPTLSEIAQDCDLSLEEVAEAIAATGTADSLQRESGEDGFTLEQVLSDGNQEEQMVESIALRAAIDTLPERERNVIALRYYRGLTQDQSAKILKVSQVQVSRLERRAIERLRTKLI